ncbi:MAG: N-acetylglucosamine-6-phosphate deacetylase [Desulfitobacteriaceae bacterium]
MSGVRIVLPSKVLVGASITINQEHIVAIEGSQGSDVEGEEDWIIPGLIDTHVHGAGGADIMDAQTEALIKVAQTLLKHGTTAFLATTMTADEGQLLESLKAVGNFIKISCRADHPGVSANQQALSNYGYIAECLGVHLEGPFISEQFSGAQKTAHLQEPSVRLLNKFQTWSENNIKILTLAPELPKCQAVITESIRLGIIPSAGHSAADWVEAQQGKSWGIRHVTHGFNAMRSLHHRDPGLIGMALEDNEVKVEIIADLLHIHQSILNMLYRLKGAERLILISDGMRAVGMPDGEYELGGQIIYVRQAEARLVDGSLAGSTATLLDGVKTMIFKVGVPIIEAVHMASLVPARLLGLDQRMGSLEKGKEATFLRLDPAWKLKEVWIRGKMILLE